MVSRELYDSLQHALAQSSVTALLLMVPQLVAHSGCAPEMRDCKKWVAEGRIKPWPLVLCPVGRWTVPSDVCQVCRHLTSPCCHNINCLWSALGSCEIVCAGHRSMSLPMEPRGNIPSHCAEQRHNRHCRLPYPRQWWRDHQSHSPASSLFICFLDLLGNRLESEGDSLLQTQACLCYICAGNVEKLVACWTKAHDGNSPLSLQVGNSVKMLEVTHCSHLALKLNDLVESFALWYLHVSQVASFFLLEWVAFVEITHKYDIGKRVVKHDVLHVCSVLWVVMLMCCLCKKVVVGLRVFW